MESKLKKPTGKIISEKDARWLAHIYSNWVWSPLYSFANGWGGNVLDFEWQIAIGEIDRALKGGYGRKYDAIQRKELTNLRKFLTYKNWQKQELLNKELKKSPKK